MQEKRKKRPQVKRQKLSGAIKKIPFLFIRFALSLLLLFLHSSHCLPLTKNRASGANHGLTASLFPSLVSFPLCPFGEPFTASGEEKKLPHELILMSVKVQREMVLEEKRIRSVSCQTFIQNFPSFHQ